MDRLSCEYELQIKDNVVSKPCLLHRGYFIIFRIVEDRVEECLKEVVNNGIVKYAISGLVWYSRFSDENFLQIYIYLNQAVDSEYVKSLLSCSNARFVKTSVNEMVSIFKSTPRIFDIHEFGQLDK